MNPYRGDVKLDGELVAVKNIYVKKEGSIKRARFIYEYRSGASTEIWQGDQDVPSGTIIMWDGYISEIPPGWSFCNGQNGTPDLRDKFIRAGTNIGATGGGTHTHTLVSSGSHTHTTSSILGHDHRNRNFDFGNEVPDGIKLGDYRTTNNDGGHSHSISGGSHAHSISPVETLIPYYTLTYIMKN